MKRRTLLEFAAAAAATQLIGSANAQLSDRPVKLVVGFAAGGSADVLARLIAEQLTTHLGTQVLVENKTGASGRIAAQFVKDAAPDGHTLLWAPHGAVTLFPYIFRNLRYDPAKDFTPISRLTSTDYGIAVSAQSPARDIATFKAWAAGQGNRLTFATPGSGTVLEFIGRQAGKGLGIAMEPIAYRGSTPAMTDLMGNVVNAMVNPVGDMLELKNAGKLRIIATTGATRSVFLPDVPTLKESGVDLDVTGWNALYGPAGMPAAVTQLLQNAVQRSLVSPTMRERLATSAFTAAPSTREELAQVQKRDSAFWAEVVKSTGYKPQE